MEDSHSSDILHPIRQLDCDPQQHRPEGWGLHVVATCSILLRLASNEQLTFTQLSNTDNSKRQHDEYLSVFPQVLAL